MYKDQLKLNNKKTTQLKMKRYKRIPHQRRYTEGKYVQHRLSLGKYQLEQ